MLAAINTGPLTHLDHLVPLCYLLEIPLIVTDPDHKSLGEKFYPMVEIRYLSLADLSLDYIARHFDTILTCGKFWAMELGPSIEIMYGKKMHFIFSPHGYSDKETLLNHPISQEIELVYAENSSSSLSNTKLEIGNIRLWFYQQYKDHFDALAAPFFAKQEKKTILYAPTWETKASPTSFFQHIDKIVVSLAPSYNLLVKLHPLLEENDPSAFYRILGKYEKKASFILDFPLVYPLLEKTDIYLGDYSSIGYDFLFYDRPMFFLGKGGNLGACGKPFEGAVEGQQMDLSSLRRQLYERTFAPCKPEKIKALLSQGLQRLHP